MAVSAAAKAAAAAAARMRRPDRLGVFGGAGVARLRRGVPCISAVLCTRRRIPEARGIGGVMGRREEKKQAAEPTQRRPMSIGRRKTGTECGHTRVTRRRRTQQSNPKEALAVFTRKSSGKCNKEAQGLLRQYSPAMQTSIAYCGANARRRAWRRGGGIAPQKERTDCSPTGHRQNVQEVFKGGALNCTANGAVQTERRCTV